MAGRWIPGVLGLSSLAILVALVTGGAAAEIVFAFLAVAFPAGLMLLGLGGRDGSGRATRAVVATLVLLVVGVAALLGLRGHLEAGPRILGLPLSMAIQLLVLLAGPLVVVALGFAHGFRDFAPGPVEMERLRRLSRDETETEG